MRETKDALATATYTFPAPEGQSPVDVKIIDMLGKEMLDAERI